MIEKDCALGNVQLTVQTVCFTEFLTLRAVSRVSANIVLFSLQLTEVMRGLRTRPSAVPTQYGLSIRLMIKLHASLFRRQWQCGAGAVFPSELTKADPPNEDMFRPCESCQYSTTHCAVWRPCLLPVSEVWNTT